MAIEKRTYADLTKAKAATDELASKGFKDVKTSSAADKVLVTVNAPFGDGAAAAKILDSHEPLSAGEDAAKEGAGSAAGRLGSKITDPATPLSNLLGWPVLTNAKSPFWPETLIDDPAPLSHRFGWPILSGPTAGVRRAPVASPPENPPKAEEGSSAPPSSKGQEGSPDGQGQANPPS